MPAGGRFRCSPYVIPSMNVFMELVFFIARPEDARGVASSHDLPGEMAAEPIRADGFAALMALGERVATGSQPAFRQLRDGTCCSYPVWSVSDAVCTRLRGLDDDQIDVLAELWQPHAESDVFDRSSCLIALREGLGERAAGEALFVLIEERVL